MRHENQGHCYIVSHSLYLISFSVPDDGEEVNLMYLKHEVSYHLFTQFFFPLQLLLFDAVLGTALRLLC